MSVFTTDNQTAGCPCHPSAGSQAPKVRPESAPNRYPRSAPKGRYYLARGVSPWNRAVPVSSSPERATHSSGVPPRLRPFRAFTSLILPISQGLTPLPKLFRPMRGELTHLRFHHGQPNCRLSVPPGAALGSPGTARESYGAARPRSYGPQVTSTSSKYTASLPPMSGEVIRRMRVFCVAKALMSVEYGW
jgi:hypothetical protein